MRNQTNYDKLIGRIGEEYYILDYIFKENDSFKGATASIVRPITYQEAEQRREDFDKDGELWRMAVEAKQTTMGHDDWVEFVLNVDGDNAVFDFSFYDFGQQILDMIDPERETYELTEGVGCGRSFYPDMQWDELYEPELWQKIVEIES